MTLAEYLRIERVKKAPTPNHMGLFTSGIGAPSARLSSFSFFYIDEDTDDVYFNDDGSLTGWTLESSSSSGYENIEGSGDPTSVTPDAAGQDYTDTDTGNIWRANSTTAGDWTLEVVAKQISFASNTLSNPMVISGQTSGMQAIHLPGLVTVNDDLTLANIDTMVTLDLSSVTIATGDIDASGNALLQSIDASSLATIDDSTTSFADNPALTSVDLSGLVTLSNFASLYIYGVTSLPTLQLPSLTNISPGATLDIEDADITTLNLSTLTLLDAGSYLTVANCTGLTSINVSSMVVGGADAQINFSGNALPAAQVNAVLARCVASPLFTGSGVIKLEGGTNAAPTGQGSADVLTLTGRGLTVTTT